MKEIKREEGKRSGEKENREEEDRMKGKWGKGEKDK